MKEIPPEAEFWGIEAQEINLLVLIMMWFNGKKLEIRDEERAIGTHHDLPVKDMCLGAPVDYSSIESGHDRLLSNGFLREEYICRRKVDWSPTEKGIRAIRDCLEPWNRVLRPYWADSSASGPIYGDPNEGLLHRKGVEIAAHELPKYAWTHDHRRIPYGIEYYPEDEQGEACHDLHVQTEGAHTNIGVEVLTSNNNAEYLMQKWERFAEEDRTTIWLFDSRKTACQMFNTLGRRGRIHLDGGQFKNAPNWSAQAINYKLWRSESNYRRTEISDIVHTLTGLLEDDGNKLYDLFDDYFSKA